MQKHPKHTVIKDELIQSNSFYNIRGKSDEKAKEKNLGNCAFGEKTVYAPRKKLT